MRRSVLIADDQEIARMAFATIMSKRIGFERVVEASSLDEALDVLATDADIEVALIDLVMPGMQTAASVAAVRECYPNLKVVVISGSSRREDILLALTSGAHGYIIKDYAVSEITKAILQILDGSIYVPKTLGEPSGSVLPSHNGTGHLPTLVSSSARGMTPRQVDVLQSLSKGLSNKEIARTLNISEGTVKLHVAAVFRMLNVRNRSAAAVAASRLLHEGRSINNIAH